MAAEWTKHLKRLRGSGERRSRAKRPSASLNALLSQLPKGGVFVDLGCGESGDVALAAKAGMRAFGLDLYRPKRRSNFIQADISKAIPFRTGSVDAVACHAVTALIRPWDRIEMYDEVARILKPDGLFSTTIYPLTDGFPAFLRSENETIIDCKMHRVRAGLYRRCGTEVCERHKYERESWEAIVSGVRQVDPSADFVHTASRFLAFVTNGGSIKKAAKFAHVDVQEIESIAEGAMNAGILNKETSSAHLPWLDYYMDGKITEGNITLVLDVLAIRGEVERTISDGAPMYQAVRQ